MQLPREEITKIIIFRALQLGDMLCAIPAVRALRQAYPLAEITLCSLPWAKSLLERFPDYFDHFIHFPGYPGLPEQDLDPVAFTAFLAVVQAEKFDLALQMQGNGSVINPMVELFGAKYTAGFYIEGHYYSKNKLFLKYPDQGSEINRHLLLMNHLGIPSQGNNLEFPLTEIDQEEFYNLNLPVEPQRYICIHPGSRGAWRQWPVEHFAALADYCYENGFTPVITGTKEELSIAEAVKAQMKSEPLMVVGRTSLGAVGILLKNAYALISNCTGVSHMASAFQTKSIVISMDKEPGRWAPINRDLHYVIDWTEEPDFDKVAGWLHQLLSEESAASHSS